MAAIYSFSAQPASVSGKTSKSVTEKIINILPSTKKLPDAKKQEKIKSMDHLVRKYAHFTMFSILGVVLILTLLVSFSFKSLLHLWATTLVVCLLYAISDEVHQLFVDGRSCELKDVAIDFLGSFSGSGLIMIILTKYY